MSLLLLAALLGGALPARSAPRQRLEQRPQQQGERPVDPEQRAAGGERAANDDGVAPGDATLMLAPSRLRLTTGDRALLSLSVLAAEDLRRLPATIRFDADVLELASVRLGSGWDDTRTPVLLYDASRPGEVVIGLALLDRDIAGISGTAELIELEFVAIAPGVASLRVEDFALVSADSRARAAIAVRAQIVVQ